MTWYPTTRKRLRKLEATNSPHYRADTKRGGSDRENGSPDGAKWKGRGRT